MILDRIWKDLLSYFEETCKGLGLETQIGILDNELRNCEVEDNHADGTLGRNPVRNLKGTSIDLRKKLNIN